MSMTSQTFLIIFLSLLALEFLIERFLSFLNVRHVLAHKETVPEAVKGIISDQNYQKSIKYTLTNAWFGNITAIVDLIIVLFLLFSGILSTLYHVLQNQGLEGLHLGVAFFFSLIFINSLLHLPFEVYETFSIEAKFGFNQTTVETFIMDKIKGTLLLVVIGTPFFYALLAFVSMTGKLWWLWATFFVIGFQFVMMVLFPIFIAPIFNKFSPLEDSDLKKKLEELAQKCHFAARGIFVMDGSKRSNHSNAYFTGLGKARRIVLYDTLIQQMDISELVAVLAHEIGHFKKKHIVKMLIISSLFTGLGFYVLSLLINWLPMYHAFGIQEPSIPMGIVIFSFTAGIFTFWISPIMNALSRKHEYEADAYAAEQTHEPQSLESGLLKLSEKNLSNLTPHPAYSAYHYSHPTLVERITALRKIKPTSI
jgi:STE24 endopeptidase